MCGMRLKGSGCAKTAERARARRVGWAVRGRSWLPRASAAVVVWAGDLCTLFSAVPPVAGGGAPGELLHALLAGARGDLVRRHDHALHRTFRGSAPAPSAQWPWCSWGWRRALLRLACGIGVDPARRARPTGRSGRPTSCRSPAGRRSPRSSRTTRARSRRSPRGNRVAARRLERELLNLLLPKSVSSACPPARRRVEHQVGHGEFAVAGHSMISLPTAR